VDLGQKRQLQRWKSNLTFQFGSKTIANRSWWSVSWKYRNCLKQGGTFATSKNPALQIGQATQCETHS
jgi:hypothetical protein